MCIKFAAYCTLRQQAIVFISFSECSRTRCNHNVRHVSSQFGHSGMGAISTGDRGDMSPPLFKILFVSPPTFFNSKNRAYWPFGQTTGWECELSCWLLSPWYIKNKNITNCHRRVAYTDSLPTQFYSTLWRLWTRSLGRVPPRISTWKIAHWMKRLRWVFHKNWTATAVQFNVFLWRGDEKKEGACELVDYGLQNSMIFQLTYLTWKRVHLKQQQVSVNNGRKAESLSLLVDFNVRLTHHGLIRITQLSGGGLAGACSGPDNVRSPLKEENDYISSSCSLTSVHMMNK